VDERRHRACAWLDAVLRPPAVRQGTAGFGRGGVQIRPLLEEIRRRPSWSWARYGCGGKAKVEHEVKVVADAQFASGATADIPCAG
jgi:hypothetical protein